MIEAGTPNTLMRRGFTKESLLPGTEIVVDGYQSKDGSHRANGRDLTLPERADAVSRIVRHRRAVRRQEEGRELGPEHILRRGGVLPLIAAGTKQVRPIRIAETVVAGWKCADLRTAVDPRQALGRAPARSAASRRSTFQPTSLPFKNTTFPAISTSARASGSSSSRSCRARCSSARC